MCEPWHGLALCIALRVKANASALAVLILWAPLRPALRYMVRLHFFCVCLLTFGLSETQEGLLIYTIFLHTFLLMLGFSRDEGPSLMNPSTAFQYLKSVCTIRIAIEL